MEQYNVYFVLSAVMIIVLLILGVVRFREGAEIIANKLFGQVVLVVVAVAAVIAAAPVVYQAVLELSWLDLAPNLGKVIGAFAAIKLIVIFDKEYPVVYHRD